MSDPPDSSLGPTIVGTNRWLQAQRVVEEARERPAEERAAFVDEACGEDTSLRSKVERLLRQEHEADGVVEQAVGDVLRADSQQQPPPSQLGKYEIVEKVGQGGFGVVYRGRDPLLRRDVAVKVCSTEDKDLRDRFFREGRIAAGLQHANVTTVHDLGVESDMPFLVQEFLTGTDLEQVIRDRAELDTATKLDYLVQIARGLAYAHGEGVVHRDLKPSNIRLLESGTVKIMDFGIAKLLHEETDLTRTGTAIGTVGYLAPEQLAGGAIDARADIFSFGVLVYELLGYQRPFQGETFSQVSYRLLYEEPRPLPELWPACPEAVARLVERCLAKVAENRYASMREVLVDLEAVAEATASDSRRLDPTVVMLPPPAPSAMPQLDDSALTTKMPVPGASQPRRLYGLAGIAVVILGAVLIGWMMRGSADSPEAANEPNEIPAQQLASAASPAGPAADGSAGNVEPSGDAAQASPSNQGERAATDPSAAQAIEPARDQPVTSEPSPEPRIPPAAEARSEPSTTEPATVEPAAEASSPEPADPDSAAEPVPLQAGGVAGGEPTGPKAEPAPTEINALAPEASTAETLAAEKSTTAAVAAEASTSEALASEASTPAHLELAGESAGEPEPAVTEPVLEQVKLGDHFSASDPEVVPPRLISKPQPVYPKRARRRRQEARVVVGVYVNEKGKVIETVIQQSGPQEYGFNDAAVEAARAARFEPATKRTVPGKMWTTLPFVFTLDRGD
ncbi:MAG: TonB family protein [Acidobacteriota bacterium]